uniref:Uncharacterized protein n=1 Tax=viral metagenome TaxID=1070528 RepID=A0A6C0C7Z6_9ZZZZ
METNPFYEPLTQDELDVDNNLDSFDEEYDKQSKFVENETKNITIFNHRTIFNEPFPLFCYLVYELTFVVLSSTLKNGNCNTNGFLLTLSKYVFASSLGNLILYITTSFVIITFNLSGKIKCSVSLASAVLMIWRFFAAAIIGAGICSLINSNCVSDDTNYWTYAAGVYTGIKLFYFLLDVFWTLHPCE